MILHQCYQEAISDFNRESSELTSRLSKNTSLCAEIARNYESDFLPLSKKLKNEADAQPGWLGDELEMHFAKQKLSTLQLILKACK